MQQEFKHIKVYEETHRKFRAIAMGMGVSLQDFMQQLADDEVVKRGLEKAFQKDEK